MLHPDLEKELEALVEEVFERQERIAPEPQPAAVPEGGARHRVVVTGLGAVTPLGNSLQETWEGLLQGRSGIGRITQFDPSGYPCQIAGEVKDFDPGHYMDAKSARRMARFSQLTVAATRMAIADGGLDIERESPERVGVLIGTSVGSLRDVEEAAQKIGVKGAQARVSPYLITNMIANAPAYHVSIMLGALGYNSTVITACAAGTQAIGEAAEVIRRGLAEVMVAGGTEASVCELGLAGFCAMRAMPTSFNDEPHRAARPFEARREGFVGAEAAAILVLETLEHARRREAPIYAEVLGYGVSGDAYNLAHPDPEGMGAVRAMSWALRDARLEPQAIDYINAHGAGTPVGDHTETMAIKRLFGPHARSMPISSTKSMIGHPIGAAGAVEAAACALMLKHGVIHPTINYEEPDPECDLDYVPNEAREVELQVVLSNSFGLGGQNACLVLSRL